MASTKIERERWQVKRKTVSERNKYMFNNPLMSDIKFAVPNTDTDIPAHKYVLAVSSPVLFAMFYGDLAETRDTIDITDCDPDIFLCFLPFLYCDEANFGDADCAIKVLHLADKYDVPSLAEECVKYLDGNMDPLCAFDVLSYARQFSNEGLETACWEVVDYNAEGIVADDSFLNIKQELLVSFLSRSQLHIDEATLFKGVDRWAARRCEEAGMTVDGANKRRSLGEDLLKNFRFPLMSPTQFSDVVIPKEILTTDEVIDVFKSFSKVPIHGGLKFSVHPRATSINNASVIFCQTSDSRLDSVIRMFETNGRVDESKQLTFAASKHVFLCGLEFLFSRKDSRRRLRLSVSRTGKKIKELSATSRDYHGSSSSRNEATNVFFNTPFYVHGETCYTIELIEASSRSQLVRIKNSELGFEIPIQNDLTFTYCAAGCHGISPKRSYEGYISALLFTMCYD